MYWRQKDLRRRLALNYHSNLICTQTESCKIHYIFLFNRKRRSGSFPGRSGFQSSGRHTKARTSYSVKDLLNLGRAFGVAPFPEIVVRVLDELDEGHQ